MRAKMACCLAQICIALLLADYAKCLASMPYQLGEKNVESGQMLQWSFDSDPVGGLPADRHLVGTGQSGQRQTRRVRPMPSAKPVRPSSLLFPWAIRSSPMLSSQQTSNRSPAAMIGQPGSSSASRTGTTSTYCGSMPWKAMSISTNTSAGVALKYRGGSAKVTSGAWQELRVEVKGNTIRGFLNDKQVVEARDDTFKAGKVGLWTKADSVTCFDNVKATAQ